MEDKSACFAEDACYSHLLNLSIVFNVVSELVNVFNDSHTWHKESQIVVNFLLESSETK